MNEIEFGEYIKKLRKNKGMTLDELSQASNVSQPYLSNIENGKRGIPQPETLKKLYAHLEVDFMELMIKAGHIEVKPLNFFGFNADSPEKYEELKKMMLENTPNEQIIGTPEYNSDIRRYLKTAGLAFGNRLLSEDDKKIILNILKWRYPEQEE